MENLTHLLKVAWWVTSGSQTGTQVTCSYPTVALLSLTFPLLSKMLVCSLGFWMSTLASCVRTLSSAHPISLITCLLSHTHPLSPVMSCPAVVTFVIPPRALLSWSWLPSRVMAQWDRAAEVGSAALTGPPGSGLTCSVPSLVEGWLWLGQAMVQPSSALRKALMVYGAEKKEKCEERNWGC